MSTRIAAGMQTLRLQFTPMAVACLLVGAAQTLRVNLIGEAALSELLLPVLAAVAMTRPEGRRFLSIPAFWYLLCAMLVTLGGYILSDVIRETPEAQYLRGWGRMTMVITGYFALCAIASMRMQNLWWFAAGMGVGRIVYLRLIGTPIGMWKFSYDGFGYGEPMTIAAAAAAYFLPPRLASALLVIMGVVSVYYDFRIQSLMCLVLAGVIWARSGRSERNGRSRPALMRIGLLLGLALIVILAGLKLTEDEHSLDRRGVSDIGRTVGKLFAMKAIAESPLIGYGSWSRNREFQRLHEEAMKEVAGKDASRFKIGDSSSATHSMILQAWVEGGIFATAFFLVLGYLLIRVNLHLMLRRPLDGLTPVLLYFGLYGLWHIIMSAFAAPLRVHLAFAATCVVAEGLMRLPARRTLHQGRPMPQRAGGMLGMPRKRLDPAAARQAAPSRPGFD